MDGRRCHHPLFTALAGLVGGLALGHAHAAPPQEAFYQQLLKTPVQHGYQPTRTFTIITDEEHGNQLVAVDDPDLRFNMLWMQQYQPGYKVRNGGAALGEVLRDYLRSAYKSFRERNAQTFSRLPDENGSLRVHTFSNDVEYHLNWNGRDMKLGIEYDF